MSQTENQQSTEQPRRRSLFKNNKFLNKFKANSKDQVTATEPTTLSSVELPQIEQLQPIDTTIAGENNAETNQDQSTSNNEKEDVEENNKETNVEEQAKEDREDKKEGEKDQVATVKEDVQDNQKTDEIKEVEDKEVIKHDQANLESKADDQTNDHAQAEEEEVKNNEEPSEENEETKKENEKATKRTSLIQKWFKKSSKPTIDTSKKEEEAEVKEQDEIKAKKDEQTVTKPSSPLGRKFNELLSRLPNKKDKKQTVTVASEKVQINEPSEIVAAA
ncbi:unnamed protein product [Cunninghamella blakesleeana]